ncbi:hypothetical protein VE02_01231 [Pseudogymnoascus sp. 03VT05]|nr:hypothetical protein VE02_01231 [Pseudogymnoascus sp. 03VT05]
MSPSPSFLCTFCWLPQYPPTPLKTLGTESRICCPSCYEQILNLAICWVCGEVVVRSEEAVSLGWCFWHRHCFGCLICGERLRIVEGEGELDVVPVCGGCEEGGSEGGEGGEWVRREIHRRDGGLGEARWERLVKSNAEPTSHNEEPEPPVSPPPVYITITDPINRPSFQPSPTKPIPRWMRQFPNGREREQVHLPSAISSAATESEVDILPIENARDLHPPFLHSLPEEQKPPLHVTHVSAAASAIPEAILAYNDRRMTPKIRHQRPEYGARAATPLYTGGEMGVGYLKRYHTRVLEERERGLQESKTGNIVLERVRELGSVKQVVDRAKSMQMEVWSEEEEEGDGQRWVGKEMLRKEVNGLFRQG